MGVAVFPRIDQRVSFWMSCPISDGLGTSHGCCRLCVAVAWFLGTMERCSVALSLFQGRVLTEPGFGVMVQFVLPDKFGG